MKTIDKVWLVVFALFWASLIATFLIDYSGLIETSNFGYVEDLWISWIGVSVALGVVSSILTRFLAKD